MPVHLRFTRYVEVFSSARELQIGDFRIKLLFLKRLICNPTAQVFFDLKVLDTLYQGIQLRESYNPIYIWVHYC